MKKHSFYSLILLFIFISPYAMAEWTIPGTHCLSSSSAGIAAYDTTNAIYNNKWGRSESELIGFLHITCTSPIYADYGSNLDMDFIVHNNSREAPITCMGFSLDAYGNIVQDTSYATTKDTPYPVRLTASQSRKISNAKPVTVMALCSIPDRGTKSCGQFACGARYDASKLLNIKVY